MTLTEIYEEVGRLLNDVGNTRWITATLLFRANQAATIIQNYANSVKITETLTPTANTAQVTLNAKTMDILRVTFVRSNGDRISKQGTSRFDLDFDFPNWENLDAGEPQTWWYDASNQQINLVPTPDSNNAITNGLEVLEVRTPAAMTTGTDVPFDSNNQMVPYHMAVVHWIVAQCWLDDGTPEALSKAQYHRSGSLDKPGQYEVHIKRLLDNFDVPEDAPTRIKWSPQGGRIGGWGPTKSNPLGGW